MEKNKCEVTGKVCYSQRDAGEMISQIRNNRKGNRLGKNKKIPKRSYVCRDCGSYHLTHEPFLKKKEERLDYFEKRNA